MGRPRLVPIDPLPKPEPFVGVPLCHRYALSIEDAAAYLGVGVTTIRTLKRNGMVPHVRLIACVRFRRADLEALADRNV
jgi:excisionase family DNA binding protein